MGADECEDCRIVVAGVLALLIRERGLEATAPMLSAIRRQLMRKRRPGLLEAWDLTESVALQIADMLGETPCAERHRLQ